MRYAQGGGIPATMNRQRAEIYGNLTDYVLSHEEICYNVRMKSSVCQTELNLQERSQADTGELFCRILKERINDRYTYTYTSGNG